VLTKIDKATETRLRHVLDAAGLAACALQDCRRLDGGLNNRSYRVTVADQLFVVRLSESQEDALSRLETETDLLRAVAAAGLGPELIAVNALHAALVTRYVAAESWTPQAARKTANIERAASLLRRLHCVAALPPAFEPASYAQRYCERLAASDALDVRARRLADELKARAREFEAGAEALPGGAVLCHNDLVAANILDNGELILVDFEYAVLAQPIVDLASLAAMNDFDADRRERLLNAYYEPGCAPYGDAEFVEVVRLQRLLAYFWALSAPSGRTREQRAPFAVRPQLTRR
jgi:thiamine kinase-like enzyme